MAEKHYDVEAVKARLLGYRDMVKEIEANSERLERLKTKMYGVGAQNITDMPRAPSHEDDRIADLVQDKTELEEEIRSTIEKKQAEKRALERIIKHLRRSEERSVIRIRYFDCASWNEVVDVMFGDQPDLLDKEENYLRRVYKLHGQALYSMAKYIAENEPDRLDTGGQNNPNIT